MNYQSDDRVSAYARRTTKSSSVLRRLSHRTRYNIAVSLISPKPGQRILDYGACSGELLKRLYAIEPAAHYEGYDINEKFIEESKPVLQGCPIFVSDRVAGPFDTVACLEVLEHVPNRRTRNRPSLAEVLAHIHTLLAPGGRLVVSVPIESGPASLIKNVVRFCTDPKHPSLTFRNAVLSGIYLTRLIDRKQGHMGFDFRKLRETLSLSGFAIKQQRLSPVHWAGSAFNSQVYWLGVRQDRC